MSKLTKSCKNAVKSILQKTSAGTSILSFYKNHKPGAKTIAKLEKEKKKLISEKKKLLSENKQLTTALQTATAEKEPSFEEFCLSFEGFDKDHVWCFNSGHAGRDFRGNPKYMFVYINKYRPDIKAYWICPEIETIEAVRALGYEAYLSGTKEAEYAMAHTGVAVVEQVKVTIPVALSQAKLLNLYHGVGFKRIERKQFMGDIAFGLASKYIDNNRWYRDHQLMLVTSPTIEREFREDCGIDEDKLIRAGYPRCMYNGKYDPIVSYDHDLRAIKGLGTETKMVVYAPTFRAKQGNAFASAMTDLKALYECCERNNLLLIFKVHPNMEKEMGFLQAKEAYGDKPHFFFWDNRDDFYEIIDQIDMGIIDYSSIMSDMVCAGVKHYIRYIFDYDEYMQEGFTQGNYFERTAGEICYTFEELIKAIDTYPQRDDSSEFERIKDIFWQYAEEDDFEKIIRQAIEFKVVEREYPTLYSFDVFDTLISRKTLQPKGIFYAVREKMLESGLYPLSFVQRYPELRVYAENNIREYYRKTCYIRDSERTEITFREIFDRLAGVYNLTEEQVQHLMDWEIEEELNNVIPLEPQISLLKSYLEKGDTVVLISDMYLEENIIREMLCRADPVLAELPLFLSCQLGVQKVTRKLYLEVYKSFDEYNFGKWIHHGDTERVDIDPALRMSIQTRKIPVPALSDMETALSSKLDTYDGYLVSAMQARLRNKYGFASAEFVIDFVSLIMVPYIDWVLRDAIERGFETLYFISRDGHHMKKIADEIISVRNYKINTRYIYASRRVWLIPSFVNEIDPFFWDPDYGCFVDVPSKDKLLRGLHIDEETFREIVPEIDLDAVDWNVPNAAKELLPILANNKAYEKYLLGVAAEERKVACAYLKQEINFDEKFAIVEYWGRGYNQECHRRLMNCVTGDERPLVYYYSRTILPTIGDDIRLNFTTKDTIFHFIESIFANMPYKSIENYLEEDGRLVPEILPCDHDTNLFHAMDDLLPIFAHEWASLPLRDRAGTARALFDFLLEYFDTHKEDPLVYSNVGKLVDSVTLNGAKREYARAYTEADLTRFANKEPRGRGTKSIAISISRSHPDVQAKYKRMYQLEEQDSLGTGVLLSPAEIKNNDDNRKRYYDRLHAIDKLQEHYNKLCRQTVVNLRKVVVITAEDPMGNVAYSTLRNVLSSQQELCVNWINLKDKISEANLISSIVDAHFVITCSPVSALIQIQLRSQTQLIMLNELSFRFFRFGQARIHKVKWNMRYEAMRHQQNIGCFELPGIGMHDIISSAFKPDIRATFQPFGCVMTDFYFDQDNSLQARGILDEICPECKGKKVILFMPEVRNRAKNWLQLPDMEVMQQLLGDEYFVALDLRKMKRDQLLKTYANKLEIPGFCRIIDPVCPTRALMLAADAIVGDYRETFFEAALMHKPAFSYAFDYPTRLKKSANASMAYDDFNPFPIIRQAEDLAAHLAHADAYDYAPVDAFCSRFLTYCDGNASQRLYEYMLRKMQENLAG